MIHNGMSRFFPGENKKADSSSELKMPKSAPQRKMQSSTGVTISSFQAFEKPKEKQKLELGKRIRISSLDNK